MNWTQEQRDLAAADCAERIAKRIREGLPVTATLIMWIERVRVAGRDAAPLDYAFLLAAMNVETADVDAAVDAISAGKHPADSLPGRLSRFRDKASGEASEHSDCGRVNRCEGQAHAILHALEWIGAKP